MIITIKDALPSWRSISFYQRKSNSKLGNYPQVNCEIIDRLIVCISNMCLSNLVTKIDEKINQLQQVSGKFDFIEKLFVTNSIYYQ